VPRLRCTLYRSALFYLEIISFLGSINCITYLGKEWLQRVQSRKREFDYCNLPSSKILLISEILVTCDKNVKVTINQLQQVPVLNSGPSLVLDSNNRVSPHEESQWLRQILIKDNSLHA
jgi:hypothetical protein